jgi:hypothetical protein
MTGVTCATTGLTAAMIGGISTVIDATYIATGAICGTIYAKAITGTPDTTGEICGGTSVT